MTAGREEDSALEQNTIIHIHTYISISTCLQEETCVPRSRTARATASQGIARHRRQNPAHSCQTWRATCTEKDSPAFQSRQLMCESHCHKETVEMLTSKPNAHSASSAFACLRVPVRWWALRPRCTNERVEQGQTRRRKRRRQPTH